jgi:hypothetical protein
LKHPQIKSGSHHGYFSKNKKHIAFHGLTYHHWNDFGGELSSIKKHNPIALMEDKPPQLDVFNKAQWMIALCYVEYKIFKELFLSKVVFLYGVPLLKKSKMEIANGFFLFLVI